MRDDTPFGFGSREWLNAGDEPPSEDELNRERSKGWWAITNGDPCPECSDSVIVTNGEVAECTMCGWDGRYDDLNRGGA